MNISFFFISSTYRERQTQPLSQGHLIDSRTFFASKMNFQGLGTRFGKLNPRTVFLTEIKKKEKAVEARLGEEGVVLDIAVSITTNGWGEDRGLHININSLSPPVQKPIFAYYGVLSENFTDSQTNKS